MHRPPLGSLRLLGDGAGAALIAADGEVVWWCPDRFDADPVLWSLLDADGASARWCDVRIASWEGCPAGPTSRTTVRAASGRVELWDGLVTIGGGTALVRLARALDGPTALVHELRCGGFDGAPGRWTVSGGAAVDRDVRVLAPTPLSAEGPALRVSVVAERDRWTGFVVTTAPEAPPVGSLPDLLERAQAAEDEALSRLQLPGRHPSRAVDALRVLRSLTDARSGAPVAAATTSLPEAPGGSRQFDYRFSWLRDSALAIAVAAELGHLKAAGRYVDFVTDLCERRPDDLQPLTTTTGATVPVEREVDEVAGWAASRPVRIGNGAQDQRQLDGPAIVIDAIWNYRRYGGRTSRRTRRVVAALADRLASAPHGPSSGIWERRDPVPLVSEELARWHGLDRALAFHRHRPWDRHPRWRAARSAAGARIEAVVDERTGLLPTTFLPGDRTPDAAAQLTAVNGFWKRRDPRLRRLVTATVGALEEGSFLRRYPPADDGFSGVEAAFVPSSWWAVTALATIGRTAEASRRADDMCAHLPPLQPEQWDVERSEALGNTPLLWSHMEAARALYALQRAQVRRRVGAGGLALWTAARSIRRRVVRT